MAKSGEQIGIFVENPYFLLFFNFLTSFFRAKLNITYTRNEVEVPSYPTVPCTRQVLQRSKRYDFYKVRQASQLAFSPIFGIRRFHQKYGSKKRLNVISSLEIILETVFNQFRSLISTLPKIVGNSFFRKKSLKNIKNRIFRTFLCVIMRK